MSAPRVLEALRVVDQSLLSDDGLAVRQLSAGQAVDAGLRAKVVSPLGETYEVMLSRDPSETLRQLAASADKLALTSLSDRAEALAEAADSINSMAEQLTRLIAAETGKSISQAREEVSATAELLSRPLQLLEQRPPPPVLSTSLAEGPWSSAWVEPRRGPALVLASFTSPFFTAAVGASMALLRGSPALVKSPWQGSASAAAAISLLGSTDLGEFVSLIHHRGLPAQAEQASYAVVFGRPETAQSVRRQLGVPVYSSCGGRALALVCTRPEDVEGLAKDLVESASWHAGQGCGSVRWVLARADIADELVESAEDLISQMSVGDPLDGADVGPLRDRGLVDMAVRLINDAVAKGASASGEVSTSGNYVSPLVISNVPKGADVVWRDLTAPVLAVMQFTDCEEALSTAALMSQASTAVVYWDLSRAAQLASAREVVAIQGREGSVRLARAPCYWPPSQLGSRPSLLLF